jgi:hypothetical protein
MKLPVTAIVAVSVGLATSAHASILSFDLDWSGASFGNGATAVGTISLDDALMNNPGSTDTGTAGFITAFSITVSGSAGGDGTFGLADFATIFLDTGGLALDLTQELVGQPTLGDPWGTSQPGATGGDFNMFSNGNNPLAPNGSWFFELSAASGEQMLLTSFRPVPAPGAAALLGLGGLMAARRRRH